MIRKDLVLNDENIKLTIENDYLNRNSKLVTLAKMLSNVKENLIISIDGNWGSGKTFFINQFKYVVNHIDEYSDSKGVFKEDRLDYFREIADNSLIVYYNSWENDMHTNCLESLLYNILDEYPKMKNQVTDFKQIKDVIKDVISNIVRVGTHEMLDINSSFDKLNTYEDLANEIFTIEEKKKAFNNLIDKLIGKNQRLILIIDELDRCKPSFAVEMLETIKHFYNNDKLTIIVSTNNRELSKTINKYYGENFNSMGYLDRFYDLTMFLDNNDISDYLKHQFVFNDYYCYETFSKDLMNHYKFTLRECNHFMTMYNLLEEYISGKNYNNENYIYVGFYIPLAIALCIHDKNLFYLFITKQGEEVVSKIYDSLIKNKNHESVVCDLLHCDENKNIKEKFMELYYKIFDENYYYDKIYFLDIISLFGSKIRIDSE